jgi:hypothetical protein
MRLLTWALKEVDDLKKIDRRMNKTIEVVHLYMLDVTKNTLHTVPDLPLRLCVFKHSVPLARGCGERIRIMCQSGKTCLPADCCFRS